MAWQNEVALMKSGFYIYASERSRVLLKKMTKCFFFNQNVINLEKDVKWKINQKK
jgi:hypothetical protein